jgi:hypothetical protein
VSAVSISTGRLNLGGIPPQVLRLGGNRKARSRNRQSCSTGRRLLSSLNLCEFNNRIVEFPTSESLCLVQLRYLCNGSGRKLVDSRLGSMTGSLHMANSGLAPALAPTCLVLGPLSTQGGFQYWYLACFPDCIVAVRLGIGAFFVLGMSNDDGVTHPALFGLVGVLVNHLLKPKALAYRQRMEAMVQSGATSGLRSKPNSKGLAST